MKKTINIIFALATLVICITACSGDSYQKRLDKERKAIKNFLADNGIETIKKYPGNIEFDENVYYLEEGTGVYFRVINPGKLTDTLSSEWQTKVTLRFDSVLHMVAGGYEGGNNYNNHYEMTFTYGDPSTYTGSNYGDINWSFMSQALVLPLQKGLGAGAEVSLIVPFINGSAYQKSSYEAYYFPKIKYRFNVPIEPEEEGSSEE